MTLTVNKVNFTQPNYTNNQKLNRKQKINNTVKAAALVGSTLGVVGAMGLVTKQNPVNLIKKFKSPKCVLNELKKMELNGRDVIEIASSSVAGGFIAGSLVDPEHTKAKAKEGIIQLIGNYIIPSSFVTGGIKLNKALNNRFNYPPQTPLVKFMFGMASLVAGVFAGNYVSQKVNKNIFKEDEYRPLKPLDWGLQTDNVCLVTSVANEGTKLAKAVSKIIPMAHIIPGYLTGVKQ